MRVWALVVVALLAILPAIGPAAPPPSAPERAAEDAQAVPPPQRVTPDYRDAVYGDLLVVGNSVLRCPDEDADCLAASAGTQPGANNDFAMALASDSDTFAGSSADLTIPPGAQVRYAQLNWGGHTGRFLGLPGASCV